MKKYNEMVDSKNHPEKYRQLHFYRLMGLPEDVEEGSDASTIEKIRKSDTDGGYDNLHICAHLYASDRNSLYLIARALDRVNDITRIASLSHTVIIHTHGAAMRTIDWASDSGKPISKWFTIEASTSRSGENRVLHQGQLWGPDGTLVATTLQDGLLRVRDEKL
jgi:acyl-CoA thioesterase